MSTNPRDIPGASGNPLEEMPEKDEAGNPVRDIIKEQVSDELKQEDV